MARKPRLFIGSASETRGIVDALEEELRPDAEVVRWDLDTFRPGHYTLEELDRATENADFAVFVLGREDLVEARGRVQPSPRDNVVFEAGLFTAALGRERTFYVVDGRGTKLPSDWAGLGYLTFDGSEGRSRDKVFDAVKKLRAAFAKEGLLAHSGPHAGLAGHWWQFVENLDHGAILSLLEITPEPKRSHVRVQGRSWGSDGNAMARYRTRAAEYEEGSRTLFYYWEGEHPKESSVAPFFGVGQIVFEGAAEGPVRGTGWYSTSNPAALDATQTKWARYIRAAAEEVALIEQGAGDARAVLIRAKLEERMRRDV